MINNTGSLQMNEVVIPEKMNIFQRIGNLFFSPKKLFAYTAKKPTILFPLIVLCVFSLLSSLLTVEQFRDTYIDTLYSTGKAMGGEITVDEAESFANWMAIGTVASTPLVMAATWLITTLILYLVFRLAGCEKGLKKYFSMVAYISIISVIGQLLHGLYIYFTGDIMAVQVTSLASLINADAVGNFVYGIATNVEVFNIWTYILYGIGFVYTGGAKKRGAYIVTALIFVIVTLVSASFLSYSSNLAEIYNF